jgi:anti-repressor protein
MNELINITLNENNEPVVSARDLHKSLKVKTRFSQWVEQNFKILEEGYDFSHVVTTTQLNQYGGTKERGMIVATRKIAQKIPFKPTKKQVQHLSESY